MNSHSRVTVLALLAMSAALAPTARSQADSATHVKPDAAAAPNAAAAPDTARKQHGLFGKLKGAAKNKTVQSIAKAAVCTAVPGGQYVVGAVDAAQAKSAGGVASSAANAASGAGCIPGMGGAAALGAKGMPGAGGVAGALGTAGAMGAMGAAAQGQSAAQAAAMSGMMNGGAGGAGMPAASAQSIAAMQAMMAQMQAGAAASAAVPTEGDGQQMKLSGTPADEIRKGKLTIRHIDWMRGSPGISMPATPAFIDLMTTVGRAVKESGGAYRVDIYMDNHYSDAEAASLGPQRSFAIISMLQDRAQVGEAMSAGSVKRDKEQRVEIVRVK